VHRRDAVALPVLCCALQLGLCCEVRSLRRPTAPRGGFRRADSQGRPL